MAAGGRACALLLGALADPGAALPGPRAVLAELAALGVLASPDRGRSSGGEAGTSSPVPTAPQTRGVCRACAYVAAAARSPAAASFLADSAACGDLLRALLTLGAVHDASHPPDAPALGPLSLASREAARALLEALPGPAGRDVAAQVSSWIDGEMKAGGCRHARACVLRCQAFLQTPYAGDLHPLGAAYVLRTWMATGKSHPNTLCMVRTAALR